MKNIFLLKIALCMFLCATMPLVGMRNGEVFLPVDHPKMTEAKVSFRLNEVNNIRQISLEQAKKQWPLFEFDEDKTQVRVVELPVMRLVTTAPTADYQAAVFSTDFIEAPLEWVFNNKEDAECFFPENWPKVSINYPLCDKIELRHTVTAKIYSDHQKELDELRKSMEDLTESMKIVLSFEKQQKETELIAIDQKLQDAVQKHNVLYDKMVEDKKKENERLAGENKKLLSNIAQLNNEINNWNLECKRLSGSIIKDKNEVQELFMRVTKDNDQAKKTLEDAIKKQYDETIAQKDRNIGIFQDLASAQLKSIRWQRNVVSIAFLVCLASLVCVCKTYQFSFA